MYIRPLTYTETNYTKETKQTQTHTHTHTQTHTGPRRTKPLLANSEAFKKPQLTI